MILGLLLHLSPPKENLTKSLCGEVVRTWQCEPFRSFNTYKIYCLFVCTFYVCVVCVHFSLPVHVPMLVQRTLGSISSTLFRDKTSPSSHQLVWQLGSLSSPVSKRKHCTYKCVCFHAWLCGWVLGVCTQVLVLVQPFFPLSHLPGSIFSF